MKKFTLERAQYLVKREMGIDAASLTAPASMNEDPDYPFYEMCSGNQQIELHVEDVPGTKIIALSVAFENCAYDITQFFYADNLEFASKATEVLWWEGIEDLSYNVNIGSRLRRLRQEVLEARRDHIAHIGALNAQAEKVYTEIWNATVLQDFEKAVMLWDTERVIRRELNGEETPTTAPPETVQTSVPVLFLSAKNCNKRTIVFPRKQGYNRR